MSLSVNFDHKFDPPSEHDYECQCPRCHAYHVDNAYWEIAKEWCLQCEEIYYQEIMDGKRCEEHGVWYMEDGKCGMCLSL